MFGRIFDIFRSTPKQPPAPPVWLDIAVGELGVHEFVGPETHNPRILEYHQKTTLRATDDETPWCSSFVNWVLDKAGVVGTSNAQARSFLAWGIHLSELREGAVVVFKRGKHEWQGHVGFVHSWDDKRVWVVGGNQGGRGGEFGGGVTVTEFPIADILDVRWPKSIYNSTTVQAAGGAGFSTIAQKLLDDPLIAKGLDLSQSVSTGLHVVLLVVQLGCIAWIVSERAKRMMRDGA